MSNSNASPESAAPRELRVSQAQSLARASWMLAAMIALSRLTGFGRTIITSNLYGQNATTDAYNAAFNIPDTISILIAGGALATGFVPVFTGYIAAGKHDAARHTFRAMMTLLGGALALLSSLAFALTFTSMGRAFALTQVAAAQVELYFNLLRVLLAAQFFFVLGGLFTGTLNALRLFWYGALQPVAFNLGIIVFGLVGPRLGYGIESQAWGALAGALVGSIFIQVPAVRRSGLSLAPLWDARDEGVKRVLASLAPVVFGLASGQLIALMLPRFLAGSLGDGATTALDNANRIMQLPLALLAAGPAIALYPSLSLLAAQNKTGEIRVAMENALRRTLLLSLGAAALLLALRVPIVQLLLEHGRFTPRDTELSARVLAGFAWGLPALAAQQFLSRGFFARGDTRPPVVLGIAAMLLFFAAGFVIVQLKLGAPGLALAASLALTFLGATMHWVLRVRLESRGPDALLGTLRLGAACALAAFLAATLALRGATWFSIAVFARPEGALVFVGRALVLAFAAAIGGAAFLLTARLLKLPLRAPNASAAASDDTARTTERRRMELRRVLGRRSRFRVAQLPPREKPSGEVPRDNAGH